MASNGDQRPDGSSYQHLRRPKAPSSKSGLDPVEDLSQKVDKMSLLRNDVISSKVLSPLAQEFVPRAVRMPDIIPETAYYSALDQHVGNGAVSGWPPVAETDVREDPEMDDYFALSELKDFIDQVSSTPHLYDAYIDNFTEMLNTCIDEDEEIVLHCIANTIVDQAIIDQNFRYSGVRLSEHLIKNLQVKTTKKTFREELLSRCQREHTRRESLAKSETEGGKEHLRGAILFIADLSTRLGDKQLIGFLPDFIDTLLNHASAENIKTACLVLKVCPAASRPLLTFPLQLCGPTLESLRNDFEKTEVKLKELIESQPEHVVAVIKNVLEFKQRGWRSAPLPEGFVNPYANGNFPPEEQDFGGAAAFEPESMYYPPYAGYSADYGYPAQYDFGECGDDANDEVVDAFEDFLRASGQTR